MDFTKLKQCMDDLCAWRIPGNSVIVYKDGRQVFSCQSGYADLAAQRPMAGGEVFHLYSCSKPITVAAALTLFEKGRYLLSDPLYEYLPEFRHMWVKRPDGEVEEAKTPITVKDLFCMTAGFDYSLSRPAFDRVREQTGGRMPTRDVIRALADEPLDFHPGEHWSYSLCHDVLAGFTEVVAGRKFRDYVKEVIFDPLDMRESGYHHDCTDPRMARQYRFVPQGQPVPSGVFAEDRCGGSIVEHGQDNAYILGAEYDSGGAGVTATLEDYGKFGFALAHGGVGMNGERILGARTIDLARQDHLTPAQAADFNWPQFRGFSYGLGLRTMVDTAAGGTNGSLGECGWAGAAGATLLVDPTERLALVYTHYMLNPQEEYYQPRLRNSLYSCL
ncbi:MAG: beta-lactamase family protein [Oscillospiraceae bacterium]|nr:beta-lactamase family protein [Oscillospiraceae bacterium]